MNCKAQRDQRSWDQRPRCADWWVFVIVCLSAIHLMTLRGFAQVTEATQEATTTEATLDQASIDQWIHELNAEKSLVRQNALRKLVEAGPRAVESVAESIKTGDLVRRSRSMAVLVKMAETNTSETYDEAMKAIEQLAKSGDRTAAGLARTTMISLGSTRASSAVSRLLAAGAEFTNSLGTMQSIGSLNQYSIRIGPEWKGTKSDLDQILWLGRTTELLLIGDQIDDETIGLVAQLPRIKTLRIREASISEAALESMVQTDSLNTLSIEFCNVNDQVLEPIQRIRSLTRLILLGTDVTASAVADLERRTTLEVDFRLGGFLGVRFERQASQMTITQVVPNSAAERAGIQPGDAIVRYESKTIANAIDFQGTVSGNRAGDQVNIVIERDGKEIPLKIVLDRYEADPTRF